MLPVLNCIHDSLLEERFENKFKLHFQFLDLDPIFRWKSLTVFPARCTMLTSHYEPFQNMTPSDVTRVKLPHSQINSRPLAGFCALEITSQRSNTTWGC